MRSLFSRVLRKARRTGNLAIASIRRGPRVAIIGCGRISPTHVSGYESTGMARVVAASDFAPLTFQRIRELSRRVRCYRDYRDMLVEERPDIVSICTWPQSHAEITRACVDAGVTGIMCEKPLALTMVELSEMLRVSGENNVLLAGGHQYRFHPLFERSAELVRNGVIGEVQHVYGEIKTSLANNGPHLVDTIRYILGDPGVEYVSCVCERTWNAFDRGYAVESAARSRVQFANDIGCQLATGDHAEVFFRIRLRGSTGEIVVTPRELHVGNKRVATSDSRTKSTCRRLQFTQFVQWVQGSRQAYQADGAQSAKTGEIILALYESARRAKEVWLPLCAESDIVGQLFPDAQNAAAQVQERAATLQGELKKVRPMRELAMDGARPTVTSWFKMTPRIGIGEIKELCGVVLSKRLNCVSGTVVKQLEKDFAKYYGSNLAMASTSGTSSIHVALASVNPNPGDEIITTPISDMGSVIPILACNGIPVWADIDSRTGNMTVDTIAAKITPRTKAVILVHLFGRPAELEPICDLLKSRGIALIEDCSQAHDAEYNGRKVGTFGEFGCFSLQQSKQITCGDGGVTLVNNDEFAKRARLFVDKGWDRGGSGSRKHEFLGMNYRMTELQGAVARVQLRKLPALVESRRVSANELAEGLSFVDGIVAHPDTDRIKSAWWIFNFSLDRSRLDISCEAFANALAAEGVRARTNYLSRPLFDEPMLSGGETYGTSGFPLGEFGYEQPDINEYPGLHQFLANQFVIPWSHHASRGLGRKIATAVAKVTAATESIVDSTPRARMSEASRVVSS